MEPNAVVLAVIDGDTMDVDLGGRRTRVRFLGIDTPEKTGGYLPAECGGDAATRRTAELLPPGTAVLLQRDAELYDRYDRLLAYVYRADDGLFVNRYLVLDGYAGTMHFEPNTEHQAVLDEAQADARAAGRGIWADCGGPNRQLEGAH
ncbi:MAG: thermonuclease family protein [Acidimicrobiaceae bacterium]|nr:thermonuclease family protein [Acidimicrobiaceae bacterium]